MTNPITPPPELLDKWCMDNTLDNWRDIATQAAQWGADQELEACCEWLGRNYNYPQVNHPLRTARRPKPPSLKDQALQVLASAPGPGYPRVMTVLNADEHALIRRALEALDD